jgi:hypothetical protein
MASNNSNSINDTAASSETPLLGLKLKHCAPAEEELPYEETLDTLAVMIAQDAGPYRTRDYLCRRRRRPHPESPAAAVDHVADGEAVDPACREKMCEWSYRCCDHFGIPREACAFAFSFLDRFMDHFNCNRTAFKLAAMSCLYISTKLLHVRQLSIASLAELSRGEFQAQHLADMEKIILQTLDFRLNPPTTQAFLSRLRILLPAMEGGSCEGYAVVADEVYQRAVFFAELSVYDYYFVVESSYETAISCYLNAIHDVFVDESPCIAEAYMESLLQAADRVLCVEMDMAVVAKSRKRLSYLYSCSEQYTHDIEQRRSQNLSADLSDRSPAEDGADDKTDLDDYITHSPVGVVPKQRVAFS